MTSVLRLLYTRRTRRHTGKSKTPETFPPDAPALTFAIYVLAFDLFLLSATIWVFDFDLNGRPAPTAHAHFNCPDQGPRHQYRNFGSGRDFLGARRYPPAFVSAL